MVSALFVPYGRGLGSQIRHLERQVANCPHDFSSYSQETVSTSLSKLKKRGLVTTRGPRKETLWFITQKGKRHFKRMEEENSLPQDDGKIRLVIYDIPEKKGVQRKWLRKKLVDCKYSYLQKSVWVGTRPLPQKLRDELRERDILSYIHIVELEGFIDGRAKNKK